jgi:hypothetical protein
MTHPATTEKGFQQSVIQLARLLGWRVHFVRNSIGSPGGWPDLTLCKDRLIFRELKTDRGRLTLEQEEWGDLLTRAGLDWAVWRPSDWPRIEATLKGQLELEAAL